MPCRFFVGVPPTARDCPPPLSAAPGAPTFSTRTTETRSEDRRAKCTSFSVYSSPPPPYSRRRREPSDAPTGDRIRVTTIATSGMAEFTGPDGKPWVPPTADDLIAKGSAAVKTEYLRPVPPLADTNANVVDDDKAEAGKRGDGGVDKKRTGNPEGRSRGRRETARESPGRTSAARSARARALSAISAGTRTTSSPTSAPSSRTSPAHAPSSPPEKTNAPTASCAATWALIPRSPTPRKTSSSPCSLRKVSRSLRSATPPRGSTRAFSSCRSPSPRVVPSARTTRSTSSAAGSK